MIQLSGSRELKRRYIATSVYRGIGCLSLSSLLFMSACTHLQEVKFINYYPPNCQYLGDVGSSLGAASYEYNDKTINEFKKEVALKNGNVLVCCWNTIEENLLTSRGGIVVSDLFGYAFYCHEEFDSLKESVKGEAPNEDFPHPKSE